MSDGSAVDEQLAYYRAVADEYNDLHAIDAPGKNELLAAISSFRPSGAELERRLRDLNWDITVTATSGPFYWGTGGR